MDTDEPIWAVVENQTCDCEVSRLKSYLCRVYGINKSQLYIFSEESQRTTVFLVKKQYIDTTFVI